MTTCFLDLTILDRLRCDIKSRNRCFAKVGERCERWITLKTVLYLVFGVGNKASHEGVFPAEQPIPQ